MMIIMGDNGHHDGDDDDVHDISMIMMRKQQLRMMILKTCSFQQFDRDINLQFSDKKLQKKKTFLSSSNLTAI